MLQRIAVEPGHRGPTVAITTRRVVPFRQQPCALLIEALSVAATRRRESRRKRKDAGSGGVDHAIALVHVLCNEAGISDDVTLAAAVLQDTIADTQLSYMELRRQFGPVLADVVAELTEEDSDTLKDRPPVRMHGAASQSHRAKLIRLAEQIVAIRDIGRDFDGTDETRTVTSRMAIKTIVEELRGTHATLEYLFDEEDARFQ